MANLTLKHIYKVYPNGTKAVNDFNMEIADKEFIVFVGPSGCGKSTTLRMIAGLEEINAGELRIGDRVVNEIEPKDRDIAMVFQNYALYPHMTVFENMAFSLKVRKVPIGVTEDGKVKMGKMSKEEIHKKVMHAAEILDITDYLDKKPKEMSGGQRQRVSLGRAIVREPKVMLLDEPLSNLDAKLRTQMRSEITKLHEELQTTFIYVTHDQIEAMTMGTRIVVMKDGFVMQIDTPRNLYRHPANKFVAGFIGTPQMNFMEGVLERRANKVYLNLTEAGQEVLISDNYLSKIDQSYIENNKPIIVGIRAEDMSFQDISDTDAVIDVQITRTEELGTEALVYCKCGNDDSTNLVIKASAFNNFAHNTTLKAKINLSNIHFFDKENELSIMPQIPSTNTLTAQVTAQSLKIGEEVINLPTAISLEDNLYNINIPIKAIDFDGTIKAEVVQTEEVYNNYLIKLKLGENILYALNKEKLPNGETTINIDFKKLTFSSQNGEVAREKLQEICAFEGKLLLEREKEKDTQSGKIKKVKKYYVSINNTKLPCPDELLGKLFGGMSGRKIFNTTLRFELAPENLTFGENGLHCEVLENMDYYGEIYSKCKIDDNIVCVKCNDMGNASIILDFDKASVVELKSGIRIV